ncbi:MAG: MarR family transcriptional regulator [Candidatus Hydrothermarchaeota archaeon]
MAKARTLQSSKVSTKFQILVEIAKNQPNVRQMDVAKKLGITPQAVSDYVKHLIAEGFVSSEGPVSYQATKKGIEWVVRGAEELRNYARFINEEVVTNISVWSAIAARDLVEGEKIALGMRDGLLYAGVDGEGPMGTTISGAKAGEDVGVANLSGIIEFERGTVTICRVPRVRRGGSLGVDYKRLKAELEGRRLVGALGVEALAALRKAGREPDTFFGVKEAAIEAAQHGVNPLVVGVDDEIPFLTNRLEKEEVNYNIIDVTKGGKWRKEL